MRNWYLYIESDHTLEPKRWETGSTIMAPGQHMGPRSILYIVAEGPLEKTMAALGMEMKTSENLRGAIAAYYTGQA